MKPPRRGVCAGCPLSTHLIRWGTVFKSNYPQHDGDEIPSLGKKTEEKTPCKIMGWDGVARARIRSMPNTIKLVV